MEAIAVNPPGVASTAQPQGKARRMPVQCRCRPFRRPDRLGNAGRRSPIRAPVPLQKARAHNDRWQPWLNERLTALGLSPTPSVGNFVLPLFAESGKHTAAVAFAFLQSRGILTRKMNGYGLPNHIRITVGTAEENEKVAATLAEFMAS